MPGSKLKIQLTGTMKENSKHHNALVFSYLALRKTIGFLGTLFPFVLALGGIFLFKTQLQSSISNYYHTDMGDVFVGVLCVIGFFLFAYKGYTKVDDVVGNVTGIFAVLVALVPTDPGHGNATLIGTLHFICAALFFCGLIYFSLFLFTKTNPSADVTRRKKQRNVVYKVCGYTMAACILLIAVYYLLPDETADPFKSSNPIYWLEAIAVVAFGISWLTKGEAILKDE